MNDDLPAEQEIRNWIEQARSGDRAALGRLLELVRPLLDVEAENQLGHDLRVRADRSDVVQQACLSAYGAIDQFRGTTEPEFVQWLLRILEHNVLNVAERERNAQKRSVEREVHGSAPMRNVRGNESSPSRRAIRDEQRVILERAIAQLPDDQRAAVTLKYLEQATLSETALRLGKSEDAVSGLLQRGLSRLNKLLKDLDANDS